MEEIKPLLVNPSETFTRIVCHIVISCCTLKKIFLSNKLDFRPNSWNQYLVVRKCAPTSLWNF